MSEYFKSIDAYLNIEETDDGFIWCFSGTTEDGLEWETDDYEAYTEEKARKDAEAWAEEKARQNQEIDELNDVMTAGEIVEKYGLSESTVRVAISRGQIRARKSSGTWLLRRVDVEAKWDKPLFSEDDLFIDRMSGHESDSSTKSYLDD